MTTRRVLLGFAVFMLLAPQLWISREAWAGSPTDHLRSGVERVLAVLDDQDQTDARARRAELRKIAEDVFDVREAAMRALGRHWQTRTAAERDEFVQLFGEVLERAYLSLLELYSGEKIVFLSDRTDGEQATVRTKIVSKQSISIPVDYRMLRQGDRWVVYDVLVEGVSLVGNYRSQFNKVIVTSSYEMMVKNLKTKMASNDADARVRRAARR